MSPLSFERANTRPLGLVPRLIFASRWLQLPLYVGLILAQGVYVYHFWVDLVHLIGAAFGLGFIIGPAVGGILSKAGYSVPAFVAAGVAALNLLQIFFLLPESLTEERRKDLVKVVRGMVEHGRVAVRNVRHHAHDRLKQLEKDGTITQDDLRRDTKRLQDMTDQSIKKLDETLKSKEAEIMEV